MGAAAVALAAIVAALGPALTTLPIGALRVVVGGLLLTFGLQWLRKAILRSAGLKAKHDELHATSRKSQPRAPPASRGTGFDGYSFAIAFKGVLLEGLEVAFIVLTFGANQHRIGLAAAAAALAVLVVAVAGILARAPLARVPENTLKFAVGVMLSSFGIFWGAEGAGANWPAGDAALLAIVPAVLIAALTIASSARRRAEHRAPRRSPSPRAYRGEQPGEAPRKRPAPAFILAVWDSSSATTGGWRSAWCSRWH